MLNVVVEMGRLVADPDLRQTQNGNAVTNFTIAVDRDYCKPGAERQCDFIDCTAWRGTGEFVSKYFHKGQMIAIMGSIQTGTYTDKAGNKRKQLSIDVKSVNFCGSKKEQGIDVEADNPYPDAEKAPNDEKANKSGDSGKVPSDEDLPF